MGFKVDFDALDTFHNNVATQANTWQDQLKQISSAVETLHVSQNMSGVGADSIRAYMEAVHSTLLATLSELISLHSINVLLYKNDYQQNIDTGLHAVIRQDELESISYTVERHRKKASDIFDDAVDALNKVKDIFYVSYRDVSDVDAAHISVKDFLQELGDEIVGLEGNHVNKDFEETGEMIRALKSFIQEQSATGRDYKTCFDPNSLAKSSAFRDLYSAHMRIQNNLNEKAPAIERAIGNEQERAVQIQEELERERAEREKKARIINWVVTGVCIVGSVVAIAATGGAATPLVVGAISAVSGATMAGTRNLTNQYVENGNLNNTDWGSFGKDVLVGGVTGFITGYAGATVSGAITSGLSQTTIGNALLNSPNALVRIGSGAVIGSVSEIGSGIVSRGAGATVQGLLEGDLNLEDVKNQMFDGKSILIDGTIGGVSGGYGEYKKIQSEHIEAKESDIDWEHTSNTKEEQQYIKELDGETDLPDEFRTPEAGSNTNEPEIPTMRRPKRGKIIESGKEGTFDYIPDDEEAKRVMAEYGQDTIKYKNNAADFSPYKKHNTSQWGEVDCEVDVGVMTKNRNASGAKNSYDYDAGNFNRADEELSRKISQQTGKSVTANDIKKYRTDNNLTWHEVENGKTMQLIPTVINAKAPHTGGVSISNWVRSMGDVTLTFDSILH